MVQLVAQEKNETTVKVQTNGGGCPFSQPRNPDRMYPLKNLIDGSEMTDTLCMKAEESHCTYKRCTGSIYMPKMPNARSSGIMRPVEETKRMATEFFDEYFGSKKQLNSEEHKKRVSDVLVEVDSKGYYDLEYDEICFGAKQAWRNAERCIGRIQWKKLHVIDARNIKTAREMYEVLLKHVEYGTNEGNLRSTITVFPPRSQNKKDCRIWNAQLVRYAGHRQPDGSIIGDPASVEITEIAQKLGWKAPGTAFDILPWVLQAHGEQPELFEIPPELILEVQIKHPSFPALDELGLKWYALPAVANMLFDCGGVEFPAAPFNGWYMATEIGARNFTDIARYNIAKPIAKSMGFDTSTMATLWKDKVMVELTFAVIDSFNKAGVTIGEHHSTSEAFMKHHKDEVKTRGGCPSDWVWIVPPISGSACPVFHQEMLKYHLVPSYEYQPDAWQTFKLIVDGEEPAERRIASLRSVATVARLSASFMKKALQKRHKITILYATETGKSETFAKTLNKIFLTAFDSKVVCMEDYEFENLYHEECLLVVTSTFGNGEAPDNGKDFAKKLQKLVKDKQSNVTSLPSLRYGIFGLGSRAYPQFCEFAHFIDRSLKKLSCDQIIQCGEGDDLCGQEESFEDWAKDCFELTCKKFSIKIDNAQEVSKSLKEGPVEWGDDMYRFVPSKEKEVNLCHALSAIHKKKIFPNKVISVENLQSHNSGRATDLIKIKRDTSEDLYNEPGDHVCIYPNNNVEQVRNLLSRVKTSVGPNDLVNIEAMGKDEDGEVHWKAIDKFPLPCTLERVFTSYIDITSPPSSRLLKIFADHATSSQDKARLLDLATNNEALDDWKFKNYPNIYETLCEFESVDIDVSLLITHLPILKTRFYSISSANSVHPDELHATVALVKYQTHNGHFHEGVCSSYMHRLRPGDVIPCNVRRVTSFSLPEDKSKPVIMIGPGTGIAPFRAFWQQRAFDKKNSKPGEKFGEMILFFGCRDSKMDDIYAKETSKAVEEGIITKVHTAFSRDKNHPKRYVQYLMKLNYLDICDLLAIKDAHFYVCGDVTMAADVNKTLIDMFEIYMACSSEAAKGFVDKIKEENRYHEDIYGVTLKTEQTTERVRQGAKRVRRVTSLLKYWNDSNK